MFLSSICAFAAFFYLIGAIVWCEDRDDDDSDCPPYTMTLNTIGSFLVAAGGVFLIVSIVTGSSGTQPA